MSEAGWFLCCFQKYVSFTKVSTTAIVYTVSKSLFKLKLLFMNARLLTVFSVIVLLIASCSKLPGNKSRPSDLDRERLDDIQVCFPPPPDSNCSRAVCTGLFKEIQLEIVDANSNPVILDTCYLEDTLGNKLPLSLYGYNSATSSYVVFNDSWLWQNRNKSISVRFVGIKNGVKMVDEVYDIVSDCCHVFKISGKDKVILQ